VAQTRAPAPRNCDGRAIVEIVNPHCPSRWLAPLPLRGGHALPSRVLPGPMEGITAGAFCAVMNELELVSAWVTPFIRVSRGVLRPARVRDRLRAFSPLPVIAQLMGTDIPLLTATAARLVSEPGVIGIDLNCACPMPIVVANGGGGGRLRHPSWIRDALLALRAACPATGISVKVRVGMTSDHELPRICDAIREGRPDFVVMHYGTDPRPTVWRDWLGRASCYPTCCCWGAAISSPWMRLPGCAPWRRSMA
jgi:hypothetical protein